MEREGGREGKEGGRVGRGRLRELEGREGDCEGEGFFVCNNYWFLLF